MFTKQQKMIAVKDLKEIFINKEILLIIIIFTSVVQLMLPSAILDELKRGVFNGKNTLLITEFVKKVSINRVFENEVQKYFYYGVNEACIMTFLMSVTVFGFMISMSSFIVEKEKKTLETLLYCPVTLRQVFVSKLMSSFILSFSLAIFSFIIYGFYVNYLAIDIFHALIFPTYKWLIVLFLIVPAMLIFVINASIYISMRAKTYRSAKNWGVFVFAPVVAIVVAQAKGFLLLDLFSIIVSGIILAIIDILFIRFIVKNYKAEKIL